MKQHRFHYQPAPVTSTIDWCWTFVVLLTGIIFWLEVTHFQWITMCFFIAFFFIAGLEVVNRQLILRKDQLIIKDMFGRPWHRFNLNHNDQLSFTKHSVTITNHGRHYKFSLFSRDLQKVQHLIKVMNR